MLTVVCVYKTFGGNVTRGGNYDASWVQKLQNGVRRHLSVPHRFVCLSDAEIPGVEVIPLLNGWEGWWSKVEMFRPDLFDGPVLSFDLDVLITSSIDCLAGPWDSLVMLRDHIPTIKNSTCMWWDASNPVYGKIYEAFAADPNGRKAKHIFNQSLGDQGLIADTLAENNHPVLIWQDLITDRGFYPFSYSRILNPVMANVTVTPDPFSFLNGVAAPQEQVNPKLNNAMLIYSLGTPKFNTCTHLEVVKRNWF